MSQFFIFIFGMIVGGIIVWFLARKTLKHKFITSQNTHTNKLENVSISDGGEMPALIERQTKEKEKNKQKINERRHSEIIGCL